MGVLLLERIVVCICSGVSAYMAMRVVMERIGVLQSRAKKLTLDEILCDRVLCFALFVSASSVVGFALEPRVLPVCVGLSAILARRAPTYLQRKKQQELRTRCEQELDALADTVAMGVRAGLNFDTALSLYCSKFEGVLAREMKLALVQWQSGIASREQALMALAQRVGSRDLERFAGSVVQAVKFGSPLADTLAAFSRELRCTKRSVLEQKVEKAPVKMLIPMGTCILPAMLILVMGPVVLQFTGTGA